MEPHVQPLSLWRRKFVFGSLLLAFLIALPVSIFYATGYRYSFTTENPTFTATGGFYIVADVPEGVIYIDDKPAQNIRSFRSASYIQGITPGQHQVHVQAPGVHTWVKEVPVSAHIVTEVEAFNLPLRPQIRFIPEFLTATGTAVVLPLDRETPVLEFIPTFTIPLNLVTSSATTTYRINQEYVLLRDLLREQASSTSLRLNALAKTDSTFGFSTSSAIATSTLAGLATTTVSRDTVTLFARGDDVFARAVEGNFRPVPYYFCAPQVKESEVFEGAISAVATTSREIKIVTKEEMSQRNECRDEIQIDRQGKNILSFDFYPLNQNLVLMHLEDGVYVTEIDDRAWQNTQPLYLGSQLELILYRGGIYIKEGNLIFEVVPEIAII